MILLYTCIALLISGCYIPKRFDSTLEIDQRGAWRYVFKGSVMSANLLRKFAEGELDPEDILNTDEGKKYIAIYLRDLQRIPGVVRADYVEDADFELDYLRVYNVHALPRFYFINKANPIFSMIYDQTDNVLEITAGDVRDAYARDLTERGFTLQGKFSVITDNEILTHNADDVKEFEDYTALYWSMRLLTDPKPKLFLRLDPSKKPFIENKIQ